MKGKTVANEPLTKDSGDPKVAEEARKSTVERLEARGLDTSDPLKYWTAQQGPAPEGVVPVPGQVFVEDQLPDPAAQREWGIDPVQANAGLTVVSDEEALEHESGPTPEEARNMGLGELKRIPAGGAEKPSERHKDEEKAKEKKDAKESKDQKDGQTTNMSQTNTSETVNTNSKVSQQATPASAHAATTKK